MGLKTSWDLPGRRAAQVGPHPSLLSALGPSAPNPIARPRPRSRRGPDPTPGPGPSPGPGPDPLLSKQRPSPTRAPEPPRRARTSTRAPGKKGRRAGLSPFIPRLTTNRRAPRLCLPSAYWLPAASIICRGAGSA